MAPLSAPSAIYGCWKSLASPTATFQPGLTESAAINTYLGDKFRGREGCADLVPEAGTLERGRYEQQVMVVMAELDAQGLWIHRKHEALGHIFGEIPSAVAHAKQHVQKVIEVLETDLSASGPYLCGSSFSAAVSYTRTI